MTFLEATQLTSFQTMLNKLQENLAEVSYWHS